MKTVVVTGGSSGIGAALARHLVEAGHNVVATGRDRERLGPLSEKIADPARLLTLEADAASWADSQRVVARALETFGRIDGVVANAGYTTPGNIRTADPEDWAAMVLTNVLGPALVVRAALEALEASRGRVVIVGSVAGHKHSPGNLYSATKWATTGLAENLRMELASSGVTVALLSPGIVDTAFYPAGPPGPSLSAEQVASLVVWLLEQPYEVDVGTLVVRPTGQVF